MPSKKSANLNQNDLSQVSNAERQESFSQSVTVTSGSNEPVPISHFLRNFEKVNGAVPEGLKAIEKILRATTWVAIHATDAMQAILHSGRMLSTKRLPAYAHSGFTTGANKSTLEHTDYIFFRVQAMAAEMNLTRYGSSSIAFKLDDLQPNGWISLLDQHSPFSRETTRALVHQEKTIRAIDVDISATSPKKWLVRLSPGGETTPELKREVTVESQVLVSSNLCSLSSKLVNAILSELIFLFDGGGSDFCTMKNEQAISLLSREDSSQKEIEMGGFSTELMKYFFRPELKACAFIDLNEMTPLLVHNPIGLPRYMPDGSFNKQFDELFKGLVAMEKLVRVHMLQPHLDENGIKKIHDSFYTTTSSGQKLSVPTDQFSISTLYLPKTYLAMQKSVDVLVSVARLIDRLISLETNLQSLLDKPKKSEVSPSKAAQQKWKNTTIIPGKIRPLIDELKKVKSGLAQPCQRYVEAITSPMSFFEIAIKRQYWQGVYRALGIRDVMPPIHPSLLDSPRDLERKTSPSLSFFPAGKNVSPEKSPVNDVCSNDVCSK